MLWLFLYCDYHAGIYVAGKIYLYKCLFAFTTNWIYECMIFFYPRMLNKIVFDVWNEYKFIILLWINISIENVVFIHQMRFGNVIYLQGTRNKVDGTCLLAIAINLKTFAQKTQADTAIFWQLQMYKDILSLYCNMMSPMVLCISLFAVLHYNIAMQTDGCAVKYMFFSCMLWVNGGLWVRIWVTKFLKPQPHAILLKINKRHYWQTHGSRIRKMLNDYCLGSTLIVST